MKYEYTFVAITHHLMREEIWKHASEGWRLHSAHITGEDDSPERRWFLIFERPL